LRFASAPYTNKQKGIAQVQIPNPIPKTVTTPVPGSEARLVKRRL
jgi:hypothetical protein